MATIGCSHSHAQIFALMAIAFYFIFNYIFFLLIFALFKKK